MGKKIKIFGEFVAHLTLGAAMFTSLLLFGGALSKLEQFAGPIIKDESFLFLMNLVEKCILYTDITFVVWLAIYSTYKAIKEMVNE